MSMPMIVPAFFRLVGIVLGVMATGLRKRGATRQPAPIADLGGRGASRRGGRPCARRDGGKRDADLAVQGGPAAAPPPMQGGIARPPGPPPPQAAGPKG